MVIIIIMYRVILHFPRIITVQRHTGEYRWRFKGEVRVLLIDYSTLLARLTVTKIENIGENTH